MNAATQSKETPTQRQIREEAEERARHAAMATVYAEKRHEWHRRWSLSLAIANAGGLVLLTSGLLTALEKNVLPSWYFLPGLWSFVIGMLAAGVVPAAMMIAAGSRRWHQDTYARSFWHGQDQLVFTGDDVPEPAEPIADRHWALAVKAERWSNLLPAVSASAFAVGVLAPLILLSAHIARHPAPPPNSVGNQTASPKETPRAKAMAQRVSD